jgi:hypothetical protein
MIMQMYAIYDTVADVFNKPFTAHNDADAIRAFSQSFEQGNKANKQDYVLYHIGEYNDSDGSLYPGTKDSNSNPMKIYSGFDIGKDQTEENIKVVKSK